MNLSNAQLCIVALYGLNTLGLVCYFIVDRRDHLREVAEVVERAEAPTRYTLSVVATRPTVTIVERESGPANPSLVTNVGGAGGWGVSSFGPPGQVSVTGIQFVTEEELMAAYLKQLETTLPPEATARLLRIRR